MFDIPPQMVNWLLVLGPACIAGYFVFKAQTMGRKKKYVRPEKRNTNK